MSNDVNKKFAKIPVQKQNNLNSSSIFSKTFSKLLLSSGVCCMKKLQMIDSVWVRTGTAVESSFNPSRKCHDSPFPPKYSAERKMRKI